MCWHQEMNLKLFCFSRQRISSHIFLFFFRYFRAGIFQRVKCYPHHILPFLSGLADHIQLMHKPRQIMFYALSILAIHFISRKPYEDFFYGGIHCGEVFEFRLNDVWVPVRVEMGMDDKWYLVGLPAFSGPLHISGYWGA